tara:strand:+ start:2797 stop:3231 length:435 start_codon:yes stop_codon:yes gene_type:complete
MTIGNWQKKTLTRFENIRKNFEQDIEIIKIEMQSYADIISLAGKSEDFQYINTILEKVKSAQKSLNNNIEISRIEAKIAFNIIKLSDRNKDWSFAEEILDRIDEISKLFGNNLIIGEIDKREITLGNIIDHIEHIISKNLQRHQ